jgi:hypothetical protein
MLHAYSMDGTVCGLPEYNNHLPHPNSNGRSQARLVRNLDINYLSATTAQQETVFFYLGHHATMEFWQIRFDKGVI